MITGAIVSLLADRATGALGAYFKAKAEIATEAARARASVVSNGIPGWSDEWLVLIWSAPMLAAFVPGLREEAAAGFAALEAFPDWYVAGFFSVTAAVFGIDKLFKFTRGKP